MADYFTDKTAKRIAELAAVAEKSTIIANELYQKYDVKRGLRDVSGKGVVCGLTEISEIISAKPDADGVMQACDGELCFRGYNIYDLIGGMVSEGRFGFEEVTYLLLFGKLPDKAELKEFCSILAELRTLPKYFVRDVIMKAPSTNLMNAISRGVLSLYPYDDRAEDISIPNVLRQCMQLIAQFPLLSVYSYNVYSHFHDDGSLVIHRPTVNSTAENILYTLRADTKFSALEAQILDLCLVLHAEHGGGNNSTFTTHVVSSSGTDTYSTVSASLGSLKGPRHGGANIKVAAMFDDMKKVLKDYSEDSIRQHLNKLLNKEAFDKSGLIYGMGHAVYSISDPRANILRGYVEKLAIEKGMEKEYKLYETVERIAPEIIGEKRKIYKGVSANVDFYSGLLYSLLNIPLEMYTPIFAIGRIAGWSAHRIEELSNNGKIIRPGYTAVAERREYIKLAKR